MNVIDPRHRQLAIALVQSNEYFGIPSHERSACQAFTATFGKEDPNPDELEAAYWPALREAKGLIDRGLLPGIDLHDSLFSVPTTAEQPAAVEQPQQSEPAAAPAFSVALGGPILNEPTHDHVGKDAAAVAPVPIGNNPAKLPPAPRADPILLEMGVQNLVHPRPQPNPAATGPEPKPVPIADQTAASGDRADESESQSTGVVDCTQAPNPGATLDVPAHVGVEAGQATTVADPAEEIACLHGQIANAYQMSLTCAIRIGELLSQQKQALGHGKFLPWVEEHLPFSDRTARRYMKLWEHRAESRSDTVSDLTAAYRLLAPPKVKAQGEADDSAGESEAVADPTPGTEMPDMATAEPVLVVQDRSEDQPAPGQSQESDEQDQSSTEQDDEEPQATGPEVAAGPPKPEETTTEHAGVNHTKEAGINATGTTKPTTQPETKPTVFKFKDAFDVVVKAASRKGPDLRRKLIDTLAIETAVTVWTRTDDPRSDLSELNDHVADRFEALAGQDHVGASDWLRAHVERLNEILQAAEPEQDDDGPDEDGEDDE